jgi:hypothetical protein
LLLVGGIGVVVSKEEVAAGRKVAQKKEELSLWS